MKPLNLTIAALITALSANQVYVMNKLGDMELAKLIEEAPGLPAITVETQEVSELVNRLDPDSEDYCGSSGVICEPQDNGELLCLAGTCGFRLSERLSTTLKTELDEKLPGNRNVAFAWDKTNLKAQAAK